MRRTFFNINYLLGRTPWDTNITPPELVALIEGDGLASGRALELGCGTGTNAIYLAQHGWQVTALDFAPRAIRQARRKARQHQLGANSEFRVADVSQLDVLGLPAAGFDLALDIGCLHGLSSEQQLTYASGLSTHLRPGGTYLLYAFFPRQGRMGPMGLSTDDVRALFKPTFSVQEVELGHDAAGESDSAWYRLERMA